MADTKLHTTDIHSVVIDAGVCTTRVGYAGDEAPRYVAPSAYGVRLSENSPTPSSYINSELTLSTRLPHTEIRSPFDHTGLIADWEGLEQNWKYIFNYLGIIPEESPLIIAEPSHNSISHRERLCQLLFDSFNVPAVYFAKTSVLAAFANGKTSGLVVDIGSCGTSVTPILDGSVVQKCIARSPLGGTMFSQLLDSFVSHRLNLKPFYRISKKITSSGQYQVSDLGLDGISPSFENFHRHLLLQEIKSCCFLVNETFIDQPSKSTNPLHTYVLPDGQLLEMGPCSVNIPELFFSNTIKDYLYQQVNPQCDLNSVAPIQDIIRHCLSSCDPDTRKSVSNNIILTGGSSMMRGFTRRFGLEVEHLGLKNTSFLEDFDRPYTSWIGGSILGSMHTFHQLWISKQEFQEHGTTIVERKCR
ncbi:hypothetical protein P9112_012529 [Eukaryota sp. TZLM1-RC]